MEDVDRENILHHEFFLLQQMFCEDEHTNKFFVLVFEPLPPQYFICVISDRRRIRRPPSCSISHPCPCPLSATSSTRICTARHSPSSIESFYNSDNNVFIRAPTETVCAEMTILRLFSSKPEGRCVSDADGPAGATGFPAWA